MTRPARATLYSPDMLALAVELARFPYDAEASYQGEARSRSCGSVLAVSFEGKFENLGLRVTACAVGQASAAIFARHAKGKTAQDLEAAKSAIEIWLAGGADVPQWSDFDTLAPARDYPARHGAILLPWNAALDALSKGGAGR